MTSPTDSPNASPALIRLEEMLSSAIDAGSEDGLDSAVDQLAAHLDGLADPDAALEDFDRLVDARIERLIAAERWYEADRYAACIQGLYEDFDLPLAAAMRCLVHGQMLLDAGRASVAEAGLREAHDLLADFREVTGGTSAHLLACSLSEQERHAEAAALYEEAAALSAAHSKTAEAAESLDLLAMTYEQLLRPADAASQYYAAAVMWREAGDAEQADASELCGAGMDLALASDDVYAERYDAAEVAAKRAYDIGNRLDERTAGIAATLLAAVAGSRQEGRQAKELVTFALRVLDPVEDLYFVAKAQLVLGTVNVILNDLVGADAALRTAAQQAHDSDDDETARAALYQLSALAEGRGDYAAARQVADRGVTATGDRYLLLLRDRQEMMLALERGDHHTARALATELLDRSRDLPGGEDVAMTFHGALISLALATGDRPAAVHHLSEVDRLLAQQRSAGRLGIVEKMAPFAAIWRATLSLASGETEEFVRQTVTARRLFTATGATLQAARTSAMLATAAMQRGDARAAADFAIPAVLDAATILLSMPSSAERAAFSAVHASITEVAYRAIAATGNLVLLAEFIEVMRGQSIPVPADRDTSAIRSVEALLADLTPGLPMSPNGAGAAESSAQQPALLFAPGDDSAGQIRQREIRLAPPPRIRMPWGAVALERYLAPHPAEPAQQPPAAPVDLLVPR